MITRVMVHQRIDELESDVDLSVPLIHHGPSDLGSLN